LESLDQTATINNDDQLPLLEVIDNGDMPIEKQYEKKELLEMIPTLLEELSDTEKEIITLYFYQQLSQTEIAKRLGVSQRTISLRLRGILISLKTKLTQTKARKTLKRIL